MKLHFFPLRKRNRLNRIIWSEVSAASEPGSRYISARYMAAEFPVVQDVSLDDLENYFSGEEDHNFICLAARASKFRQKNHQSVSTVFSLDVAKKHAESPNHSGKRKTQVPTTKLNSFSHAGLELCAQTSANTTNEHFESINVLEICRHLSDL